MPPKDQASRRVHERYDLEIPVVIILGDREVSATTRNVSLGGMFIMTDQKFRFGSEGRIRMRLPALKEQTEVPMVVRWVTSEGVGVQFGSLRALEVWALNQLFKE